MFSVAITIILIVRMIQVFISNSAYAVAQVTTQSMPRSQLLVLNVTSF